MSLDLREVELALYNTVHDADLAPVSFPNVGIDIANQHPRIEIDKVAVSHPTIDLKGSIITEMGSIICTVVIERGIGNASAMAMAQALRALFGIGSTIALDSGGRVQITSFPNIGRGYPDETSWRTPVKIDYRADG